MGAREITERQCSTHNRQVCQNVPKKVCNDVNSPRQVCNEVPDEVCENKFASITKYVDVVEQVARQTSRQECSTKYEKKCRTAYKSVPRTSYENQCRTEYTEECETPRSGYGA